jgi:hypothetical protein
VSHVNDVKVKRLLGMAGLGGPLVLFLANLRPVWSYTVDDAFISFRYARNLARGAGLVYNLGERVEGYTNFLWTVLCAGLFRLGADVELAAKLLGAASGAAAIFFTWSIVRTLAPTSRLPPLAPWLLASSITQTAFASSGLETELFVALVAAGLWRWLEERTGPFAPVSALLFASATLVRPEGLLPFACAALAFSDEPWARQIRRAGIYAVPVAAHLAWRRAYYGLWLPNSFYAQIGRGADPWFYLKSYAWHVLPSLCALPLALAAASARPGWRRPLLFCGLMLVGYFVYVGAVGPDWMAGWRYLAPAEPFLFVAVDLGLRFAVEGRARALGAAFAACTLAFALERGLLLRRSQRELVLTVERPWQLSIDTADWLRDHHADSIALADLGRVGWVTDARIFDQLRLVTREPRDLVSELVGERPRFVVLAARRDCRQTIDLWRDLAEAARAHGYSLRHSLSLPASLGPLSWCILERGR